LGEGRSGEGGCEHNGRSEEWDIRAGMGGTRHGRVELAKEEERGDEI